MVYIWLRKIYEILNSYTMYIRDIKGNIEIIIYYYISVNKNITIGAKINNLYK